ncbi:MAG: gamma-glutamyl-gamma-aminobutyrate hydrolase family protein [Xanthomonadales bacterium]|nr:gamma-glutamyl-gamma-aminobutyrate hydrolase family protein [Xanthomonadales bacterium]
MARVLVCQHVAAEPLGLLDPMLRQRGHRIRYVNFARDPEAKPRLDRYQALIVLGGPMQVGQSRKYPHLTTECRLIEQALHDEKPLLGICLGAQLLAHVEGARVGPSPRAEIGWYTVAPEGATGSDPVLSPLMAPAPIFQWHHWGFDCPDGATSLATHAESGCQAFRSGEHAWGFQFHLELDGRLIDRWLSLPFYLDDLAGSGLDRSSEAIHMDNRRHLPGSLALAEAVFGRWLDRLGSPEKRLVLGSR